MAVEISDRGWMRHRLLLRLPAYLSSQARSGLADLAVGPLKRPPGGQSNETAIFEASWTDGPERRQERLVLRLQPQGQQMFLNADVLAEGALLRDIRRLSSVPVPEVLAMEDDPDVLGRPFVVMSFVAGHVPGGRPSIHRDPWLEALSPGERRQVLVNGLGVLGSVHGVEWRAMRPFRSTGLDASLGELAEWFGWAARGRSYPLIEAAISRLTASRPRNAGTDVLLWGDARPGNIIFADDLSVAAALDWEMASVGPPEADLGWWLMMDEFARVGAEGDMLEGFPSRTEIIEIFEHASGRRAGDVDYFELLAAVRLAITLIPAADSLMARGLIPASSRFAQDNVPGQLIARLLGVDPPEICPDYRRLSRMRARTAAKAGGK
jgi:aminoglycoside phosphotransferase (APT) family kinase protein